MEIKITSVPVEKMSTDDFTHQILHSRKETKTFKNMLLIAFHSMAYRKGRQPGENGACGAVTFKGKLNRKNRSKEVETKEQGTQIGLNGMQWLL